MDTLPSGAVGQIIGLAAAEFKKYRSIKVSVRANINSPIIVTVPFEKDI